MREYPIFKIMLVDDHPLYRAGTKTLIEQNFDHKVAEFCELESSIEAMDTYRPDLIFLDLELPDGSGLSAAEQFLNHPCRPKVYVLTTHHNRHYIEHAKDIGLHGYLFKGDDPNSIIKCIQSAPNDNHFIVSSHRMSESNSDDQTSLKQTPDLNVLTTREQQVLYLLAFDMTSKEIGERLYLSFRTVQNHRASIKSKLNLTRNSELIKISLESTSRLKMLVGNI